MGKIKLDTLQDFDQLCGDAIIRKLNGDGFLITAYTTDAIKEGEILWQK
jgi:hypothetical protein